MRVSAIFVDVQGMPRRWAAFRSAMTAAGVESHCICPDDCPKNHATSIALPGNWLPTCLGATTISGNWWRSYLHYVRAFDELQLDADFIWCVEGDVWASDGTWRRLIRETAGDAADGLFAGIQFRGVSAHKWFRHKTTPQWVRFYSLHPIFRLSRAAMTWLRNNAEDTREVFGELCCCSTIKQCGGVIGNINKPDASGLLSPEHGRFFFTSDTLTAPPREAKVSREFICHPVKTDGSPFEIPEVVP